MSILVFRHELFEGLGKFEESLRSRSVTYHFHDLGDPVNELATAQILHSGPLKIDGLIVMGGSMSANDPLPGLADELRMIEQALKGRIPILGICLGSQLIAKALGARVYRNRQLEIGWEPVHFTATGQADPLFAGMESPTTFFHWHGETFDLPEGAEWLAWSDQCRHQAFRYRENVYGLQFHPEVTPEMIADWCTQPVNCGDVSTLDAPIDPQAHDQSRLAKRIINAWLDCSRV
jgi:GMP synthase (glutamine-hydrolysing)